MSNKYLTKIAKYVKTEENNASTPKRVLAGVGGGAMAYNINNLYKEDLHPLTVRHMPFAGDTTSNETIRKFVDKHKLHGTHIHGWDGDTGAIHLKEGLGIKDTPHAIPANSIHKLQSHMSPKMDKDHPHIRRAVDSMLKHKSGYVDVTGGKNSGAILLHELGHVVNHKQAPFLAHGKTIQKGGNVLAAGTLFSKEHQRDAWKVSLLGDVPHLADELGANARAYHHLKKYQPLAARGAGRANLAVSALSYAGLSAAKAGAFGVAGSLAHSLTHSKRVPDKK